MTVDVAGWIAAHVPDDAEMIRVTDNVLAAHDEWDSMHSFTALAWDGTRAYPVMTGVIVPSVDPDDYPRILERLIVDYVTDRLRDKPGSDPVVACLLQIEGYGIVTGPMGMIPEERAAFKRREAHMLPHRRESALVYAADIAGRFWSASKVRGFNDGPDTVYAATGGRRRVGGSFPDTLRHCAALVPPLYVAAAQSFWAQGSR
jgi:hypothetical protein